MSVTLSSDGIRSVLLAVILVRQSPLATDVTVKEFCQWETFNVTCSSSQVLLVHAARYGRMHVGRCVAKNYGHVGCTVDVRGYLDGLCSGRQSCKFVVPDESLRSFQPCPKDFASYLEVSYSCIPVQTGEEIPCYGWQPIPIKATQDGFLANVITDKTGRGSVECPWLIRASQGQKVSITLLDVSSAIVDNLVVPESFAVPAVPPGGQGGHAGGGGDVISFGGKANHQCHKYAVVRERPSVGETVICGGHERERVVYLSSAHEVEVVITKNISPRKAFRFLLHYRILGCVALAAPANGWLELSDGDVVISGCNNSKERNYLRCEGSRWTGEYSNCSSDSTAMSWMSAQSDWSSPLGILLVSTIGVALGLVVGILLLLLVVLFFKRNSGGGDSCLSPNSPTYVPAMHTDSSDFSRHQNPSYGSFVTPKTNHRTQQTVSGPTPPPPPPPPASAADKMELVAVGGMPPTSFAGSFWPYGSPPAYTPSTASVTTETGTPGSGALETAGDHLLLRQGSNLCRVQVDGDQAFFGRVVSGGGAVGPGAVMIGPPPPPSRWSPAAVGEFTECTYEFGTKRHIYESAKIPWPVIDELLGSEAEGVA